VVETVKKLSIDARSDLVMRDRIIKKFWSEERALKADLDRSKSDNA
jgi:hypothetical protein